MIDELICQCQPCGSTQVKHLVQAFRELHPESAKTWTRGRIIGALTDRGYRLAIDQLGRQHVVGLCLPIEVVVRDGRIIA